MKLMQRLEREFERYNAQNEKEKFKCTEVL